MFSNTVTVNFYFLIGEPRRRGESRTTSDTSLKSKGGCLVSFHLLFYRKARNDYVELFIFMDVSISFLLLFVRFIFLSFCPASHAFLLYSF